MMKINALLTILRDMHDLTQTFTEALMLFDVRLAALR